MTTDINIPAKQSEIDNLLDEMFDDKPSKSFTDSRFFNSDSTSNRRSLRYLEDFIE